MITEDQIKVLHSEIESSGQNQAQTAYRVLEEMIVPLKLPPSSKISEKALNRSLGFGRTPIREASQRLAIEGYVKIVPRSGVIVSEIDVNDQMNLIEVRSELEEVIAGRAARLAIYLQRRQFKQLAEDFERAAQQNDESIFIETDREFNQLVVETAQNKYVTYALAPIEAQTRRFWYLHFKRFGDLPKVATLHANIARAIGSNEEARRAKPPTNCSTMSSSTPAKRCVSWADSNASFANLAPQSRLNTPSL